MEQRLALVAKAVPVTDGTSVDRKLPHCAYNSSAANSNWWRRTIADYDRQIAQAYAAHPGRETPRLPGAGAVSGPRLLASLGSQRERFGAAGDLRRYSGTAPVPNRAAALVTVVAAILSKVPRAKSPSEMPRKASCGAAGRRLTSCNNGPKAVPVHTAVRALAFKWQRVIFRCWQNRTPYREEIYEAALRKSGSPLVSLFDRVELGKSPLKNPAKKSWKGLTVAFRGGA